MVENIASLNARFQTAAPGDILAWFAGQYPGNIAFSSSLGAEDQVITHLLSKIADPVKVFTLDTGRLFQETYDLLEITRVKYGMDIRIFFPESSAVEGMVNANGINLFYRSIELRRMCCHIRKKEPLIRALAGMEIWITGMRREQSVTRSEAKMIEWDPALPILKVNPLIDWSDDMVWEFIRTNHVPVSDLHSKGYPSIGCLPCTRQVAPGEEIRSGRWWWEMPRNKECGLHTKD